MTGANKILTVSYGTFSCTLEGFDDPFNTMKAIAEYFRDLAAEDRYFGAEPPQPDAAMLHRIAEREIQRRVEARVEENNVILRAGDTVATAAPALSPAAAAESAPPAVALAAPAAVSPAAPMPEPASEPAAAEAPAAETAAAPMPPEAQSAAAADFAREAEPAPAPEPEPEPELPRLAPAMPEGVAAKLARLRRAVSQSAMAGNVVSLSVLPPVESAAGDLDYLDDEPADVPGMEAPAGLLAEEAEEEETATAPTEEPTAGPSGDEDMIARLAEAEMIEPGPEAIALVDEEAAQAAAEDDVGEEEALGSLIATLAGGAADDLVAAAAVPAAAPAEETEALDPFALDEDLAEDESLYDLADTPETPVAALDGLGDLNDDLPEDLAGEFELAEENADEAPVTPAEAAGDGPASEAAPADIELVEATVEIETVEIELAEAETAETEAVETDTAKTETADAEAPDTESADAAPEADPALTEKIQRARARVIKIRRADATPPAAAPAPADEPAPVADAAPAEDASEEALASDEDDVARLARRAEDEMAGAENQRRLAAIKHLKAAVAATVAERRAGVTAPSDEERADPYRADLARVVRPVRPRGPEGGSPAARPAQRPMSADPAAAPGPAPLAAEGRPAPLVLVSEQRIDRPAGQTALPVRPRRIGGGAAAAAALGMSLVENHPGRDHEAGPAAAPDFEDEDEQDLADSAVEASNIFSETRDFSEFAEMLGATGLPALLEAAAAYATLVEKREHFTRPLLMRRLATDEAGARVSREEGLRSFGTLLREGRIEKVRRGQYALPQDSALLAEARRISG